MGGWAGDLCYMCVFIDSIIKVQVYIHYHAVPFFSVCLWGN